jgi:hypothetical protein
LYEQALAVARELGASIQIGEALREIGWAECDEGRFDLALKHVTEGLTILHGVGDGPAVIESLEGLGGIAAAMVAPRRAARLWGAADALRRKSVAQGRSTRASPTSAR